MTSHELREHIKAKDNLGFSYSTLGEPKDVLLYLTTPTETTFNQNEYYLSQYAATAFTFENIKEGDVLDDEWRVDTVTLIKGRERVLGLNRYGGEQSNEQEQ
ncbi:hypothetical protein H7U31_02310 [Olsenella uli]|nr:hypothetical protein [Olsenella uli]